MTTSPKRRTPPTHCFRAFCNTPSPQNTPRLCASAVIFSQCGVSSMGEGDQSINLLIGYSTIPFAPDAFSCGMMLRTTGSSRIVFTSTHSGSDRAAIVGFCSAGSSSRI